MASQDNRLISSSVVTGIVIGLIFGTLIFLISNLETKWMAYIVLLVCAGGIFALVQDKERLLWLAFLMSFQFYVSFRMFHGRANSDGLEFPLTFLLGLLLIAWYWFSGKETKRFSLSGPAAVPIGLLFFANILSLGLTGERFVGVTAVLTAIQFYVMYLIGMNFVENRERLNFVCKLFILTLLIQSLIYFLQMKLGYTFTPIGVKFPADGFAGLRFGGTVGANSAIYAAFILPLLFLCLAKFMDPNLEPYERVKIYGIPLLVGTITMIFTLRRGTWGGVALGLIWMLIVGGRHKLISKFWKNFSWSVIGLSALAMPTLLATIDNVRSGNPIASAFEERLNLMRIAMEVIASNPLSGVGPGAYGHTFKNYLTPELATGWLYRVHNYYLLIAAEIGIIGLVGFVLFLWVAYRLSKKLITGNIWELRIFGLAMGAGILGYAFAIFWEPLSSFPPNALLWFIVGVLAAANRLQDKSTVPQPDPTQQSVAYQ